MKRVVSLEINGEARDLVAEPHRSLLDALRDAGLTGTKKGCDVGECGSCTVILDGKPVCSCLVLAAEVEGATLTTIEGVQRAPGELDPLQENFMACGAAQCGFCTPGIIVAAKALLAENPNPTRDDIRFALAGNICRCTGYTKIIDAVEMTARQGCGACTRTGAERTGAERTGAERTGAERTGAERTGAEKGEVAA